MITVSKQCAKRSTTSWSAATANGHIAELFVSYISDSVVVAAASAASACNSIGAKLMRTHTILDAHTHTVHNHVLHYVQARSPLQQQQQL
jgi:hypothetical protein